MTKKQSEKTKLQTKLYSFLISVSICILSFLLFVHDFNFFEDKQGFSGFPSLRVAVWVISIFLFGISGWLFAFLNSKGKLYRFAMLAPIFMGIFQLGIYVLDAREQNINSLTIKVILNLCFILLISIIYFSIKKNE